jgi:hypothetical protein
VVEHFGGEYECFIEFDLRVDCTLSPHHTNGAFAVDGLPFDEEKGGEAQVDLGPLEEGFKGTEMNGYVVLA